MAKRILIVSHYFAEHGGGVEIIAGEIARQLTRRGWNITWAASDSVRCDQPQELASKSGNLARAPMRAWNFTERRFGVPYPVWGPMSALRLAHLVRDCDVIHLHDSLYFGNILAYVCAKLMGKPVVITQHLGDIPYRGLALRLGHWLANRTLARGMLSGCRRAVFYSARVQELFRTLAGPRDGWVPIDNGVALEEFRPVGAEQRERLRRKFGWPMEKLLLLFVGRFVAKKNLGLLRRLAEAFPAIEWRFVGWGPDDPGTWGLANVQCVGPVSREGLPEYYQAADLLVLLSVGEGFPLVVQEAMACGLPAWVSAETAMAVPAVRDVVFTSSLEWGSVRNMLQELVADRARMQEWGAAGLEFARRHWSWERCGELYDQVFAAASAPRRTR